MLRYILIILIIALIVFGLISYILTKVLQVFSKYNSVLHNTQNKTNESRKVLYKKDDVVILKGEAGKKKQTNNEENE